MITVPAAKRAIERMSDIRYFPAEPGLRAVIMEELGELCEDDSQVDWLARRMTDVCREWPRIQGLRQVYFSKFSPRNERQRAIDKSSSITEAFPDGVPSETGCQEFEPKKLSGHAPLQITDSQHLIADLADKKSLPALPPIPTLEDLAREVSERVAADRAPKPRAFPRTESATPITAEQVEEARQQELTRRAKGTE